MAKSRRKARRAKTPVKARKPRVAKCKHKTVERFMVLPFGTVAFRCADLGCNAMGVRSLGPSNEGPVEVRIEILAAEVGQNHAVWNRFQDLDERIYDELGRAGVRGTLGLGTLTGDARHLDIKGGPQWTKGGIESYLAGWLAREMSPIAFLGDHDVAAWPWDPTRSIAGQFEEWQEQLRQAENDDGGGYANDDSPVDPATKFGELAQQLTVSVIATDHFDDEMLGNERLAGLQPDARFDSTDEILPDEAAK